MSQILQALGIDQLSVEDRIALVQEIWDSIAVEAEAAIPWEQVEAEALARLRR